MLPLGLNGALCCPYRAMDNLGLEPGALPPAKVFQPFQAEENLGHVLQRKLMSKEKWQTDYLELLFVIT